MTVANGKYVVFKTEDFEAIAGDKGTATRNEFMRSAVDDAVVIRRQDHFAASALHMYANGIAMACKLLVEEGMDSPFVKSLQDTADYFHEQAVLAEAEAFKFPD